VGTDRLRAPVRWAARTVLLLYICLACLLPFAALVVVSFQRFWSGRLHASSFTTANYHSLFSNPFTSLALRNSLVLAVVVATVATVLSGVLAVYVKRLSARGVARAVDGVVKLPATVSHVVMAVGVLVALGGAPFHLAGTTSILFIAYLVLYMPQASIAARAAADQVGDDLVEASAVSGASPARTFGLVNAPLMAGGLISGWSFVFVMVVGDITASVLLSGPSNPVVGSTIYSLLQNGSYPTIAGLASIMTVLSFVVITTTLILGNRRKSRQER
jgi:iron(III) transport system permease protein